MKLFIAILLILVTFVAGKNVISVVANVRGRKFDLKAATVNDFMSQVEKLAGLTPGQQSVLFRGKLLGNNDNLSEVGVSNGDVLNVLKGRKLPHKPSAFKAPPTSKAPASKGMSGGFPSIPGFGLPSGVSEEQMKESMARMEEIIDSGFFDEFFSDPEKLEGARKNMLKNLDTYEKMIPGFRASVEDLVSTPEKWQKAMTEAKLQMEKFKELKKQGGGSLSDAVAKSLKKKSADTADAPEFSGTRKGEQ